jgi:hypothetical protein
VKGIIIEINKMKKLLLIGCIVSLGFVFSGCPYVSEVPIDKPSEKVNPKWLSTWEEQKEHDIYKITMQDEFTYNIEVKHKDKNKIDKHLAYTSTINGTIFINKWDHQPGNSPKKYALMKIEMVGDNQINISPVTENIREVFTSSDALKNFIADNMKNSYFFERPLILMRKGK